MGMVTSGATALLILWCCGAAGAAHRWRASAEAAGRGCHLCCWCRWRNCAVVLWRDSAVVLWRDCAVVLWRDCAVVLWRGCAVVLWCG